MRAAVIVLAVLACVAVVSANSPLLSRVILHTRKSAPKFWTKTIAADASDKVNFVIALKQQNLEQLNNIALAVSDPDSPKYQEFMSIDAILNMVAPSQQVQHLVMNRLMEFGIQKECINNFRDAIEVKGTTVAAASKLFNTNFFKFQNSQTKATVVKAFGAYSLPSDVAQYVEMVEGVSTFPVGHLQTKRNHKRKNNKLTPFIRDDSPDVVVPQTAFLMYQIPAERYGNATFTSQGVIEFEGQNFAPSDLDLYAQQANIKIIDPTASTIVGPNDPTNPGVEANLDIQAQAALNDEATNWFWLETDWLYTFVTHFFNTPSVPSVASISYAWSELDQCEDGIGSDECSTLGVDSIGFVNRVNVEFSKIALRGVSFLSASGDSGSNGRTDGDCSLNIMKPDYPACSPWITSVGATQLDNASPLSNPPPLCASSGSTCAATGTEVAVSFDAASFASGGGFSWVSPRPSWQNTPVLNYLKIAAADGTLPPASYFNQTNRGFPDIAALGHNFLVMMSGSPQPVGGTSVSSPLVSAMISLFNQISLKKTKKTLGFVSPLLYKMYAANPAIFHDITVGDNKCTEEGCSSSCQGYTCEKGWDPVTGLGSLNYQAAENYIIQMLEQKELERSVGL